VGAGEKRVEINKEKEKMETSNIADKVVAITGASSGIGQSTAKFLARQGARVVLGARRKNRIDEVVEEISAAGGKAIGFAVDVTKRAEVEALIKRAVDSFGRVDVIINNAGIMPIAPVEALKVEEWDRQIDVNIKGLLYGVAAALPYMQKQKSGHIINIASVFGIKVFAPGGTVYCATKSAVRRVDGRAPHRTAFAKHPLHHDLARCRQLGTPGEQFGGSDQKEFARVLQDGYSGGLDRACHRLRHRTTAEVEIDEVVNPAHGAGFLT
jgi:NADP-dependent 3-hydroxy acid dehydrogenase YdfG